MKTGFRTLIVVISMLAAPAAAQAGVVHKWIDTDGVTHYSDRPPESPPSSLTQIEVPENDAGGGENRDYYSIANQWQRMHRERLELEKIRLERASLDATRQAAEPTVIVIDETHDRGHVAIYRPHRHQRHRNEKKFRPRAADNGPPGGTPRNWLDQQRRGGFYRPSSRTGLYKFGY